MRERLVVALVALMVAVVGILLAERVASTSALIEAAERRTAERSADLVAALVGGNEKLDVERLAGALRPGDRVVHVDGSGARVEVDRDLAGSGGPGPGDLVETRPVAGGGTVTFSVPAEAVEDRVADALLRLVLTALGVLAVALLAGLLIARRLTHPFTELADVAGHIGRGDFDVTIPRYDVPEADAVARALRASSEDLESLVRRERDFAVHASHELNTPITAMRLELEDLTLAPGTPADVVAALSGTLRQLDRLSTSVAEMLDASRTSRVGSTVEIDLTALVRDTVDRWRRAAPERVLRVGGSGVVAVRVSAGSVLQVMEALLDNAVRHGEGTIRVSVDSRGQYAEILVADEGHRACPTAWGERATDGPRGLVVATEIAESLGGQLRLTEQARTTYSLVLPLSRHPVAAGPGPAA